MSKGVKIDFGNGGFTYDVYTSSSRNGTYTLHTSGFTGQTLTITGLTGTELFVKTTCPHCKDQIVKVKLEPEPISLTGSTVNGTCENCGDTDEPECNGAITLYVCGGVRPFTYQWSGSTKSGKVITSTTKDLGYLEEGNYNVIVSDSYGITGTTGFTIDVAPCNPPINLTAVAPIISTPTPTPTASSTPTPTPTPTTTPTPTPTMTPIPIDPEDTTTYYYYAMGDCNDMRYSYNSYTSNPFGPIIGPIGGCDTLATISTLSMQNITSTSYALSNPLDPCGFGTNYSGVGIGRSTTQKTEGTVYNVNNQCLSIIQVQTQYVTGWSFNLDGMTAIGGDNPCGSCDPPFTGFTFVGYEATRCNNGEKVIAATAIFGDLDIDRIYGVQLYSGGIVSGDAFCVTLNKYLGSQFTTADFDNDEETGLVITDTGPIDLSNLFGGYSDCTTCPPTKYRIVGVRCDNPNFSVTVWSNTLPSIGINDTFRVYDPLGVISTTFCWKVTDKDNYKSFVYSIPEFGILDTGCSPCDGSAPPTPTATVDGGGSGGGSGSG
jgi:hypothetical protein